GSSRGWTGRWGWPTRNTRPRSPPGRSGGGTGSGGSDTSASAPPRPGTEHNPPHRGSHTTRYRDRPVAQDDPWSGQTAASHAAITYMRRPRLPRGAGDLRCPDVPAPRYNRGVASPNPDEG